VWLEAQQAGRVGEHRPRVRLRESLAFEQLQEDLGALAGHVAVVLALGGHVAKVVVAVDDLLRRAAADAQLEAPAGDQVGRAGVVGHVVRVLVTHVDHAGADLDPAGAGTHRGKQRKRGGELAGEVVDAEERAVGTQRLRCDSQLDRLKERVGT
jgi:hypothetical protein